MMAFRLTYTPRFQKHFASLTAQEKKQVSRKLSLFAENRSILLCASSAFRAPTASLNSASTWISG